MSKSNSPHYFFVIMKSNVASIILITLCLLLISCGGSTLTATQATPIVSTASLPISVVFSPTPADVFTSNLSTSIIPNTPTPSPRATATFDAATPTSSAAPVTPTKITKLTAVKSISETATLLFLKSLSPVGDDTLFLYNIKQDYLTKVDDPTKVFKVQAQSETLDARLSPDRKKISVNTKYEVGPMSGSVSTYWIAGINNGQLKIIEPPISPIGYQPNHYDINFLQVWNNTSSGLVLVLRSNADINAGILDLQLNKIQKLKTTPCSNDVDDVSVSWFSPHVAISWSGTNQEIYCYEQVSTDGDTGIATVTLKDEQSHFLKFASKFAKEPQIVFSPNADYVALDREVYPLSQVAYYNGSLPNSSIPQPEYIFRGTPDLCEKDAATNTPSQCPIWSSSGQYVLYERKKTQVEKIAEIYDTKLKKPFSYDLVLPDYPNLKNVTIGAILDSKNLILRGDFNDKNKTTSYFLVNLDTGTIVQLPASLNNLEFID